VFTDAGGAVTNNIAAWNGTAWAPLGSGTDDNVSALIVYNDELIVGGWFNTAGDDLVNSIAAWDGTGWSHMGTGITSSPQHAIVYALAVYNGKLVAGGGFTTAGGVSASNIAIWGN
jgi:hypothetical protein